MPSVVDLIYALLPEAELFVHKNSLKEREIRESMIVKGIRIVEESELAEIILERGEAIIIF